MKELKSDRDRYMKMYVSMIKYIKSTYPNLHIDISIPTFYDTKYLNEIKDDIEHIYLMAYEFKNLEQLIRRVERYKEFRENVYVAFNCKEFKNELELELFISEFIKKSAYTNIALHNLKSYIKVSQ